MINAAVAAGLWSGQVLANVNNTQKNYQAELINAIIRNEAPPRTKGFYETFINDMSYLGSYHFTSKVEYNPEGSNYLVSNHAGSQWGKEDKWSSLGQPAVGNLIGESQSVTEGIYHNLDYMLFHNLYYLNYKNSLPAYAISEDCFCTAPVTNNVTNPGENFAPAFYPKYAEARAVQNLKLKNIENCTKDVFAPYGATISQTMEVRPHFSNYSDISVYTTKFQSGNDVEIAAGGNVKVKTRFIICGGRMMDIKPGGVLDIIHSETSFKGTSKMTNSGSIFVRDNAVLRVNGGGLILKAGSTFNLGNNAKLILEGGVLEFEEGAILSMNASSQIILNHGSIKVLNNGTFSVVHNEAVCGRIIVDGNGALITDISQQGGKFKLEGTGKNDPFIIIKPNSQLMTADPHSSNLNARQVELLNAKIEMGSNAFCDLRIKTTVTNCAFTATTNNQGIKTQLDAAFTNCNLTNVPVNAVMNYHYSGILDLQSTSVIGSFGVLFAPAMVNVTGQGYRIHGCTIRGWNNYSVKSQNLTLASTIQFSDLGRNTAILDLQNTSYTAVDDASNVELTVRNSSISHCGTGIKKTNKKLTLRCNEFSSNIVYNVEKIYGEFNASGTEGGGYNTFNKTINGNNLIFTGAVIDLSNGRNFIETGNPGNTIIATLNNTFVQLQKNQWNTANTDPVNFYTVSGTSAMPVVYTPVALKDICPSTQGPQPIDFGRPKRSGENYPLTFSTVLNDSARVDDLYYEAAYYMSAYNDSTPDDLLALNYLYDIFKVQRNAADTKLAKLQWLAHTEMKKTIENAFTHGLLHRNDNQVTYDPYVAKYAQTMTYLTDELINSDNSTVQFDLETDKAHLLHLIGHTDHAFNLLNELESCGIDSLMQVQVNHWKEQYELEMAYQEVQISPGDTLLNVNTENYIDPELTVNSFSFGADISELTNIIYPNCLFFRGLGVADIDKNLQMIVSPNPAQDYVTISIPSNTEVKNSRLFIQQSNGKNVKNLAPVFSADRKTTVDVGELSPGTYLVVLKLQDGTQRNAKLVIQ